MARARINSLSPEAIDYLGDRGNVFVPSTSNRTVLVMLGSGVALVTIVAALTYDYRWSQLKLAGLALVLFGGSYLLIAGGRKWLSGRTRKLPAGLVVTREHTVFVGDDDIEWLPVDGLISADYQHQFNGRKYEFSTVTVTYPVTVRKYRVEGMELAEANVDEIEQRKRDALVRASRSGDEIRDSVLESIPPKWGKNRFRSVAPTAVLTLAIGSISTFGAFLVNDYFHDQLSWRKAQENNTAASYREYLRTNATGRHRDDATGRLKSFYDNAEAVYRSSLKEGFDQAAVESILALLRYARETHEYQVKVSFERSADIPPDLIERLKKDFEVKTVLPLGDTFTEDRMIAREAQLFTVLQEAFKQVFPNDILELVPECQSECARLNIRYTTSFQNTIYYDLKEKEIPEADRIWSPGILIEWTSAIAIPRTPQLYSFDLESAPADTINYDTVVAPGTDPKEADQQSFYEAMVTSSFDDFRAHLLFNLGLGVDPHPAEEAAPDKNTSENNKRQN